MQQQGNCPKAAHHYSFYTPGRFRNVQSQKKGENRELPGTFQTIKHCEKMEPVRTGFESCSPA